MRRVVVDPRAPADDALREAGEIVRAGGVVAFPTDTLYGLAADPASAPAIERLFAVKGRAAEQAIALVAADISQVEQWLGSLAPTASRLALRFWPGPLTLLLKPTEGRLARGIAAADGTVGVRVPDHAVARALCRLCGRPLTATSANLTGQPASADPDEVAGSVGGAVDLMLDAGRTAGGPPSTIVDVSARRLRLVRAGALEWDTIQRCARGE